jgi:predicted phage tail protein
LFCDLVYYLLTDKTAGVGSIIAPELINTADFIRTARFLDSNKLYFDGAISQPTNVRQFIADNASFFLCNFVIANGKFSIVPALPITVAGYLSTDPVTIKQLFTSGNIIEESFSLEFLGSEERKDFQAVVKYRLERRNQLPEEQSISVRWNEPGSDLHSVESFDLSQFCTSKDHALLVARYLMALRRRVTHVVKFKTSPYGIDLAPGDYVKVITQASPYSAANNGVISATGAITSAIELEDGRYSITYWIQADDDIKTATLTVADGKAVEPALWGAVFTISDVTVSSTVYMVEQLTLNEDGLVDVVAVEFPCTSTDNSLICLDILSESNFLVE